MTTQQHTPTLNPQQWTNGETAEGEFVINHGINRVALLKGCSRADAAFIVRACNAHEGMLDALVKSRRMFEIACGKDSPYIREMFKVIDAAIAKAEGK